jgi:NADPH-dependent 2,4-dienoyl-CoA reductase/sulfur reductase-like enzyme
VCTPEDVLLGRVHAGKTAVVVGSGNTGLECVEKLQDDGAKVAMVDMLDEAGKGMYPIILNDLMSRITPHEPEVLLSHKLLEITDDGVVVEDVATGETKNVSGELICLSLGSRPNEELIESFRETFEKVLVIGSAVQDGRIHDATKQAYTKGYVFE